jgi:thiamine transport system ATP-binding protein
VRPARRPFAILFQDNNLFPHLSAFDNVALGLAPGGRPDAEQRARVTVALAEVGLAGLEHRLPAQLSGGQQGRVAIARVLVQDRPAILLDEPFAALGPALRREMLALLRQVARARDATLLLVTHDAAEARTLPQAVLVADGIGHPPVATEDLFRDPPAALRDWLG